MPLEGTARAPAWGPTEFLRAHSCLDTLGGQKADPFTQQRLWPLPLEAREEPRTGGPRLLQVKVAKTQDNHVK